MGESTDLIFLLLHCTYAQIQYAFYLDLPISS